MSISIGTSKVKKVYLGGSIVKKIYLGTNIIYSSGCTVDLNLCFHGGQYGHTVGSKIGTAKWQKNNEPWSGNVSDMYYTASDGKFAHGDILRIKDIYSAPGFGLGQVTNNGSPVSGVNGVYSLKIGADTVNANINYVGQIDYSSVGSLKVSGTATTNSLTRNAWTVSVKIDCLTLDVKKGNPLGVIPSQYRPATAQTVKVINFLCFDGMVGNDANITIHTNGNITADIDALAPGSAGGKWGGQTWRTHLLLNTSWSVI